jgi:hypothetical protein
MGIDSIRTTSTPTARTRSTPQPATADQAASDRVSLSPEALALQATQEGGARFPPGNAPAGVREAWTAATRHLSDLDRLAAKGAFMAEEISANLKYDAEGRAVGVSQRGEPGYADLWQQPGLSYSAQVDRMLEKLEQNHAAYSAKDYAFFHGVLTGFRGAL